MIRSRRPGMILLLTVALGTSACGGSDDPGRERASPSTATRTVTKSPTAGESETPASPTSSPSRKEPSATPDRRPASTVRAYFAAVNAKDYRKAWNLGGKNLGGSYSSFVRGFADTEEDQVHIVAVDGARVSVLLAATQTDGSVRLFEGVYTVRDGVIVEADVRETDSPAPESDEPFPLYENCQEARDAGDAPLLEGEPRYAPHLDRDDDGVACEPRE